MSNPIKYYRLHRLFLRIVFLIGVLSFGSTLYAQQHPPKPISVTVSKEYDLNFGTFCAGSGSSTTVVIDAFGARTKTGNILLLNSYYSAARYDVSALPGTLVSLIFIDSELVGPNGATMTLHVGPSNPPTPFVATGQHTAVDIGGILVVGPSATTPSGEYIGTFYVTFIQE